MSNVLAKLGVPAVEVREFQSGVRGPSIQLTPDMSHAQLDYDAVMRLIVTLENWTREVRASRGYTS